MTTGNLWLFRSISLGVNWEIKLYWQVGSLSCEICGHCQIEINKLVNGGTLSQLMFDKEINEF